MVWSFYEPPERIGPAKATRSGQEVPKLKLPHPQQPSHTGQNIMDLGLHLREIRERTRGMTPEEREWRKRWVMDQKLHPDEPVRVEAIYRQLNPIRRLYRYPLDRLYEKVLEPKMGFYYAHITRTLLPKLVFAYVGACALWYHFKYSSKDWTRMLGSFTVVPETPLYRKKEIEKNYPGLIEKALQPPKTVQDYGDEQFKKRFAHLNLGASDRPW